MGELRNANQILVGQPEGNPPLERPRNKQKDSTNMRVKEIRSQRGSEGVWVRLNTTVAGSYLMDKR